MHDSRKHEEVLQRGLERIRAKTPEQRRAFLVRIGILDESGCLAERYRSEVDVVSPERHGAIE